MKVTRPRARTAGEHGQRLLELLPRLRDLPPPHPGTPARAYILHSLRRSHATLGVAEKDFLAREEVFFFQDENLWGFLLDLKTASLGS